MAASPSPLYGLYLCGGKSSRMGKPKHSLTHSNGTTFLQHAHATLSSLCERTYLSVADFTTDFPYSIIPDAREIGPLGGLLAAHKAHPEAQWLVLACDLPAVRKEDLQLLIKHANHSTASPTEAVAFINPIDSVPEATATLYSSTALKKLPSYLELGKRCARHFLEELTLSTHLTPTAHTLQNVNYPADYQEWKKRAALDYTTPSRTVTVEFYAKLRQEARTEKITLKTESLTVAGVWEECRLAYNLSLKQPSVKPAINNTFVAWSHELQENDLIAFMPPFAGG